MPLVTPFDHLGTQVLAKEREVIVKMLRCHVVCESPHTCVEAYIVAGLVDHGHLLKGLKLKDCLSRNGPCLVLGSLQLCPQ